MYSFGYGGFGRFLSGGDEESAPERIDDDERERRKRAAQFHGSGDAESAEETKGSAAGSPTVGSPMSAVGGAGAPPSARRGGAAAESAAYFEGKLLDCHPYSFSPLLLFTSPGYFDKGYSNYNAVVQFFRPCFQAAAEADGAAVDMLAHVVYERSNMLYEDLLNEVLSRCALIVCCIDAHFTALQLLPGGCGVYYDPLNPQLVLVSGSSCRKLAAFLLMKCSYGDNRHLTENKSHYTGSDATATRRMIWRLWQDINTLELRHLRIETERVSLALDRHVLINDKQNPRLMSVQLTGNTCYFQVFLFAVLCKFGQPTLRKHELELPGSHRIEAISIAMCRHLLQFFVDSHSRDGGIMRPLSNSNFICDFYRFKDSSYFSLMTEFLAAQGTSPPDYRVQYDETLRYYKTVGLLHDYCRFSALGAMSSTPNTKSLQPVFGVDDARYKLARSNYYKYRAANLMFGFNAGILRHLKAFCEFNALRKNQLLAFYAKLRPLIEGRLAGATGELFPKSSGGSGMGPYREYYFMAQFEVGQEELVDVHHYLYLADVVALKGARDEARDLVARVNRQLAEYVFFSTQKRADYEKILPHRDFTRSQYYTSFEQTFMTPAWFRAFVGLGFAEINPRERDINALTQTSFYQSELMHQMSYRQQAEFEKEAIGQMARSNQREGERVFAPRQELGLGYIASIKIGYGYTYSRHNTLLHFLNVVREYWLNPDLNAIQIVGKDIRALIATAACQKIVFDEGHPVGYYNYGVLEPSTRWGSSDLAVASTPGHCVPTVSEEDSDASRLVITDRVYEYQYLRNVLEDVLRSADGKPIKTENTVLNLALLSLALDFGLYEEYAGLINLPVLHRLRRLDDTRQLQVDVSNLIHDFEHSHRKDDTVTRIKIEQLIFEASYKFFVAKDFPVRSEYNALVQQLSADTSYQRLVLLCKVNMTLCQINKSVEVDYYKLRCNGEFRTVVPRTFSKSTSDYLESVSSRYTFAERDGVVWYDSHPVFDLRTAQPSIELDSVRFDSPAGIQSMVKYLEIKNAVRILSDDVEHVGPDATESGHAGGQYLVFVADNALVIDASSETSTTVPIHTNGIAIRMATVFFNEAFSFIPCFRYAESSDVVLFSSPNIRYHVDQGGQFCTDYYGMKHELIENILSDEIIQDLNAEHSFKRMALTALVAESKTVLYFPNYILQVPNRQHLINLLDVALRLRNVSFFILVLLYLRRCSVRLNYVEQEGDTRKISGPWIEAIAYALGRSRNAHYDSVFRPQFVDLNEHRDLPLSDFVDVLCDNFTRYQRCAEDGVTYQIVPTAKQKAFLRHIITADECFHFSEVGSGKTKVILPLLCQVFLSNNVEAHQGFARSGHPKHVLVVIVPEHLVPDAVSQVFRYCLNLNFRDEYRVHDDIFALLHDDVEIGPPTGHYRSGRGRFGAAGAGSSAAARVRAASMKRIFVTSFNQFKRALTYDVICEKLFPFRERVLVLCDEVDDFLDRDKLVFNICSNKASEFDSSTLDLYYDVSRSTYNSAGSLARRTESPPAIGDDGGTDHTCAAGVSSHRRVLGPAASRVDASHNPSYWWQLMDKLAEIHVEIQDASRSVNKSFGIFNESTLRHCRTNIAHDIEGYRALIARPYESVNRAMPGSYYSDVERTIYLTYVLLQEDVGKYDDLFSEERKFISFEYWREHLGELDYDELVYGDDRLSELLSKFPSARDGLTRFLYRIILRRMEIRDRSRSVNSVDVVFNFDCVGFTGTPFIDNYPTFSYMQEGGHADGAEIPSLIDRGFYVHAVESLSETEFHARFARFQGANSRVRSEYVPSDFFKDAVDEQALLQTVFSTQLMRAAETRSDGAGAAAEGAESPPAPPAVVHHADQDAIGSPAKRARVASDGGTAVDIAFAPSDPHDAPHSPTSPAARPRSGSVPSLVPSLPGVFNVLVDLCGVLKRSTVYDVRDMVRSTFGSGRFQYVYHVGQADGADRVLAVNSDIDVQYDEEFYASMCRTYGAGLPDRIFFFIDNRNVIGKDVPFQLGFRKTFGVPLFTHSVVLAHDVDDFSKIWQAMGRSRTMNDTVFSVFKSDLPEVSTVASVDDIKQSAYTRSLYVRNCDRKLAGNLSSIYQTLISLLNLSRESFYYDNDIVNVFLEKLNGTITPKLARHVRELQDGVLGASAPARVLRLILQSKFRRSTVPQLAEAEVTMEMCSSVLQHVVHQKFEQRLPSGDLFDDVIRLLSGEQVGLLEISYTKAQQKQKQKQTAKDKDSDTMALFDPRNQLKISVKVSDYYAYTRNPGEDQLRAALNLPIAVPVFALTYRLRGLRRVIRVYPTLQFLYSHHIMGPYISEEVKAALGSGWTDPVAHCKQFLEDIDRVHAEGGDIDVDEASGFIIGAEVVLHSLRRLPRLNGRHGVIIGTADNGCWSIRLNPVEEGSASAKAQRASKPVDIPHENISVVRSSDPDSGAVGGAGGGAAAEATTDRKLEAMRQLEVNVFINFVRQQPLFSLAAVGEGNFVIGMKNQFNSFDLRSYPMPLQERIAYVTDDHGFVLLDRTAKTATPDIESFGPYFVENYVLLDALSKHEVAQNVLEYYVHHNDALRASLASYSGTQGPGFICWRFVMNEVARRASARGAERKDTPSVS